ncbi:SRPBCC family protein [Fodinicola feengrottensis]|uniref:SRPBCC family protein n=1 Tax=Fodinicola feengrottensis TaxID=435914 RepID=A0ABP4SWA8_9ACTN|nr:SRPBCC family protein [Fodinicola feengrottensis]
MELEHEFSVPAPIDVVWKALTDPEKVAPCMPGATLTEVDGKSFAGNVKVKLGPISLLYKGTGEFVEIDDAAHKAVIKASGKDSKGNGTAAATITVTLTEDGKATKATSTTDLNVTGRPAQFGRGLIKDVSDRLLGQFADALAKRLGDEPAAPPPAASATKPAETAEPTAVAGPAETAESVPAVAPRRDFADEPMVEPIDLLGTAGGPLMQRLVPIVAVAGVALLIFVVVRRRRKRRV